MAMHPNKTSNLHAHPGDTGPKNARRNTQQGGTLLGLIIGLLIGLGIALVVALSITKTGLPFVSKGAQPRAPESSSATMADPNKPLYGNKDAGKGVAKPGEDTTPMVGMPPPEPEPESKPRVVAKPAVESGKAPIVEKSVTEKSAANPDATDDRFTYFLQAGAFREQADADNAKAKLALLGFEARVTERVTDSGTLYRVRMGPFAQLDATNRIREKLSESGVDAAVVRITKSK